jgi:hypothetical protein
MVTSKKEIDTKERFERHLIQSFAFISNGSKHKGFTYENVLEFMPRLLMTHVVDLMKENRHISIIAIRRLFNFIRIF